MTARFVGVAGLPRSGSTLLCQLLAEHPQLHSDGHSSPLCSALLRMRHGISDDEFFLAQLDVDFKRTYAQLLNATRGFLRGWHSDCGKPVVIDKNRGWLRNVEYLLAIEPDARLLVCVRELGQVYGSIEAQHQRTILVDFPDHSANHDRYSRADVLFGKDGVVGNPLRAIEAMQDLSAQVQRRIRVVRFEALMGDPVAAMEEIFSWLHVPGHRIDPNRIAVRPHESDSYYRYKFTHRQNASIAAPEPHAIPVRIQAEIERNFGWYYEQIYPEWQRLKA
jgi:sulfotransferase